MLETAAAAVMVGDVSSLRMTGLNTPNLPHILLLLLLTVSCTDTQTDGTGTDSQTDRVQTIQCYECQWDHQTGCKRGAKVNNNHLRSNCTVCYKNVEQYIEGQAAASGSRRCLTAEDVKVGYTGRSECWFVEGSLHCYCMENKCNTAAHTQTYSILVVISMISVWALSLPKH